MMTRDFTATTFVVRGGETLLLFHKKIRMWLPPGGHIDPHELPCDAAVREVKEETGLDVALRVPRIALGQVHMLSQPECILLEQISPGHEHIDLIYFARVIGGQLAIADREAAHYRWCSADALGAPDIAEDIRHLGRLAIEKIGT